MPLALELVLMASEPDRQSSHEGLREGLQQSQQGHLADKALEPQGAVLEERQSWLRRDRAAAWGAPGISRDDLSDCHCLTHHA